MAMTTQEFLGMDEDEAAERVEATIASVLSGGDRDGVREKTYLEPPDDRGTFASVPELSDRERGILDKYVRYLLSKREGIPWRRIQDGLDVLQVFAGERRGAGIHRVGGADPVYGEMIEKLLAMLDVAAVEHVEEGSGSGTDDGGETNGQYFIARDPEWLAYCPPENDVDPETVEWDIHSGVFFDYPYEAILGFVHPGTMRRWLNDEIFVEEVRSVPPEESGYMAYVPYYYGAEEADIARRIEDGKTIRERVATIADIIDVPIITEYLKLLYRHRVEASKQVRRELGGPDRP